MQGAPRSHKTTTPYLCPYKVQPAIFSQGGCNRHGNSATWQRYAPGRIYDRCGGKDVFSDGGGARGRGKLTHGWGISLP